MNINMMVAAASGLLLAGCAGFNPFGPPTPARSERGVLVDPNGMTLYTFDKDPSGAGRSVCVAQCAVNWPPLKAAADAKPVGEYTILTREDGSKQWAYKGRPLYTWIKDQKPGERTGDGFNNVWRVAKP